ncbi:Ribokinase-like protein [Ochromonadaceae sp. CCMP2298]|nr:Ribokinase-like protein [Ochromonadaceae sp. CCMP2298]
MTVMHLALLLAFGTGLSQAFIPLNPQFVPMPEVVQRKIPSAKVEVVCIGEVLFDFIADESCNGLSIEQVGAAGAFSKFAGGAPANNAVALARLGLRPMFAGAVGEDLDGEELVAILQTNRVETVLSASALPTRGVMVLRDEQGDRTFAGFRGDLSTEQFADCHFDPPISSHWLVDSATLAVCMGTLGLYTGKTADMMWDVATLIKTQRAQAAAGRECEVPLLVVDLNVREVFWGQAAPADIKQSLLDFAHGVDLIKLTDEEAEWVCGVPAEQALKNPEVLMDLLCPHVGVLVTGGAKGASYHINGVGSGSSPSFPVQVVDTTGAGDAFTAGFLAAVAMDRQQALGTAAGADRALRMACAAGALACTKSGAIPALPNLQEVINLLIS